MWGHHGMGDCWWCGPGGYFPGPVGFIVSLRFWGLVIFVLVKLVQAIFRSGSHPGSPDARETLRRRYAAGEIDRAEFERMSRELGT